MSDTTVEISRELPHPIERVWHAWTDPAFLLKWLGPVHCPAVQVDAEVRVGGRWRARLAGDDGAVLWQSGTYLVVEPPHRLEMTFMWEGTNHEDGPGVETHITVHLETAGQGTRMRFVQTGLVNRKSANGHHHGWSSSFERLGTELSKRAQAQSSQIDEIL